jgi:hypothetical protein
VDWLIKRNSFRGVISVSSPDVVCGSDSDSILSLQKIVKLVKTCVLTSASDVSTCLRFRDLHVIVQLGVRAGLACAHCACLHSGRLWSSIYLYLLTKHVSTVVSTLY